MRLRSQHLLLFQQRGLSGLWLRTSKPKCIELQGLARIGRKTPEIGQGGTWNPVFGPRGRLADWSPGKRGGSAGKKTPTGLNQSARLNSAAQQKSPHDRYSGFIKSENSGGTIAVNHVASANSLVTC